MTKNKKDRQIEVIIGTNPATPFSITIARKKSKIKKWEVSYYSFLYPQPKQLSTTLPLERSIGSVKDFMWVYGESRKFKTSEIQFE